MRSVHTTDLSAPLTLCASVDWWEYGCCRDVPVEGGAVTGHLVAHPADDKADRRFLAPSPIDWVRDLELVRFAGGAARFDPRHGDPADRPLQLHLGWHGDGPTPRITADIVAVYRITERFHRVDRTCTPIDGTREYTRVVTVERHSGPNGDRETIGVMLELAVRSLDEPTHADLAGYHAKSDRTARTVHLTGSPPAFGERVPAVGDRPAVELDDGRPTTRGAARGRAAGRTLQVSSVVPSIPGRRS